MGLLDKLIGGGLKGLADGAKDIIHEINAPKEEKEKAELAIEELATKHIEFMQADATRQIELEIKNTSDARAMEIAIQAGHPSWLSRNVSYLIDLFVMCIWGSMTVYIALRALKLLADAHQVDFSVILGIYAAVSTQMGTVLNFHRGSSKGSDDKQKTIDRMTQK